MGGYWSQEPTSSGSSVTSSGSSVASSNILTDKLKSLHKASRTHKMVFVVNMALKMGKGKLAAQVGHAAVSAYRKASKDFEGQEALPDWENHGAAKIVVRGENTEQIMELHKVFLVLISLLDLIFRKLWIWVCIVP